MDLIQILQPEAVKVVTSASSKKRLLHTLADMSADIYGLDPAKAVAALLERETLGPTAVGNGVALPHARLDEVDHVVGCFMRLEKPVDFDAVDRQPVDLIFALFAPTAAGVDHLKALAAVSRTLRNPTICAKLRSNSKPASLHAVLTEMPASSAVA
ncbi:MAG: PTS sugar transporter subunit IIA [Pseudomonadota bacterium]